MRALYTTLLIAGLLSPACSFLKPSTQPAAPRLVLFIGVDISGSFMHGKYFDDSLEFLARYIHAHLNGLGGLEVPHSLFVGSIGGVKKDEAKTLYPIEMFQNRTVESPEAETISVPSGENTTPLTMSAWPENRWTLASEIASHRRTS